MAERKIWKEIRLYYSRNPAERWPERKNRLQKIINQFPTSQWADDAILILVGEQAVIDGNTESAIAALRQVMESYPSEHTIVVGWRTYMGCKLDYMWLLETVPLLSRPRSRPIRVDVPPSGQMREILAYFEHLEKYPRRTVDIAQLMIAQMLSSQGDVKGAIAELEAIIDRTGDLRTIVATDNQLAKRPNAHLVKSHTPYAFRQVARPQYAAYRYLMPLYQSQSEVEKAIAIGLELANTASPDGSRWSINQSVGDLLAQNGRWAKAEEQYQLAVNAYREFVEETIVEKELANQSLPSSATSWRQQIMKTSIGHQLTELEKLLTEAKAKREEAKAKPQAPSEISPSRN
jgi:tetratricopeptide (TPR) repeat protein